MKKNGFTLIELLVVISIIALLLSILMPALGLAKQQALYVVCRTKMNTLGKVAALYGNDWDDLIPGGPGYKVPYAPYYDEKYLGANIQDSKEVTASKSSSMGVLGSIDLGKFMEENNLPYSCDKAIQKYPPYSSGRMATFAINYDTTWLYNGEIGKKILHRLTDSKAPSDTFFFVDAGRCIKPYEPSNRRFFDMVNAGGSHLPYFFHFGKDEMEVASPHGGSDPMFTDGRANTLFFDGHTEGRKTREWILLTGALNAERIELGMTDTAAGTFWYGGLK